ncbi:threonine aldolase family protein [Ovoidimarina sediminis]|uniref:threonine aldolase family protein n=1 Tax=Ovoidimarina sediminis TaxID=3079856 RepID=UPI002907FFB2|nr:low specificity L-threonine aldolase [Rhodophyticola sp. MJ-SS7]MDU8943363.1 low specificity L-threonine aldolase [Rhodophyticola sp. MJ-SS7]
MNFASDNTGPAHPDVMAALLRANEGYATPYGEDALMGPVRDRIRETFGAPEAEVFLVATGTAANSLALACLVEPWQAIYTSAVSHIQADECGAPEFFTGGAKLVLVPETDARMTPEGLDATIREGLPRGLHFVQPGAVSITQVTERGTVYGLDTLAGLTHVAKAHGCPVHMDGARFTNALVALGATPAEMSWKAGIDVLVFGGTKNGLMGAEAVVFFDPAKRDEATFRRKRGAQLFSKHRYLSAQFAAYLEDDLWLRMARAANDAGQRLAKGLAALPHADLLHPAEANMIYVALPRAAHRRAVTAGAEYFMTLDALEGGAEDDMIPARLVTNWATTEAEIEAFLAHIA